MIREKTDAAHPEKAGDRSAEGPVGLSLGSQENREVHKLRRGGANLLGGRAWRFELFPLVSAEIPDLDLLPLLNRGAIPSHYLSPAPHRSLRAYVRDYLKEEVFDEGLTRNVPARPCGAAR